MESTPHDVVRFDGELVVAGSAPAEHSPVVVYLASLASSSRRTQGQALYAIADVMVGVKNSALVAWSRVRYQHTQAIRAWLAESYKPATANRMLCGVCCAKRGGSAR